MLARFGEESRRDLQNLRRPATESLSGTPALIRSASQCAGVPPSVVESSPSKSFSSLGILGASRGGYAEAGEQISVLLLGSFSELFSIHIFRFF